jgi:hypothetical protein
MANLSMIVPCIDNRFTEPHSPSSIKLDRHVGIAGSVRFRPINDSARVVMGLMAHLNQYYGQTPFIVRFDPGAEGTDQTTATAETFNEPVGFYIPGYGSRPITYDDTLIVRAYTKRKGIQGIPCWIAEGWCYWSLKTIVHAHDTKRVLSKPLMMHVVRKGPRPELACIGNIELTVTSCHVPSVDFHADCRLSRDTREKYMSAIAHHIAHERAMEQQLMIIKPESHRIRMIDYKSDIASRAGDLPCFAFLYGPTPQSSAGFWEHAYDVLLARDEMRPFRALPVLHQKAIFAVKLITLLVQWLEYVEDIFTSASSECIDADYFADALSTLSDDCDGLTKAMVMSVKSLLVLSRSCTLSSRLTEIVYILHHYVPLTMLCGTTSMSATFNEEGKGSAEITGAHFAMLMLPVDYFVACVNRTRPGHALTKLPISDAMMKYSKELPVLYGEGTGRIDPYGGEDPVLRERDQFFSIEMEKMCRTEIYYDRTKHVHFIIWPVSVTTRYFIDNEWNGLVQCKTHTSSGSTVVMSRPDHVGSVNIGSFYFAYESSGGFSRGVDYYDILGRSSRVGLIPTEEYSDSEIGYIKVECSMCAPVASLVPPTKQLLPSTDKRLDSMRDMIRARLQKPSVRDQNRVIRIYVRRECLSDTFFQLLERQLKACGFVYDMTYYPEQLMDRVAGYNISIYVE